MRIRLYNGSKKPILLTPGMPICSCTFFQMETHVQDVLTTEPDEPVKPLRPTMKQYIAAFLRAHWKWIVPTIIALAVLMTRIIGLWK